MKNGRLLLGLIGISAIGTAVTLNRGVEAQYTPRTQTEVNEAIAGAAAYLHSLRVDPITGNLNPQDVLAARQQARSLSGKQTLNLQWESVGPANGGGRARALLIDRDSSNIVYAASVSGGVYRSRTGGSSWTLVSPNDGNLAAVSITQATNGDIYYGTGEFPFIGYFGNGSSSTPAFLGGGIYKSTDNGKTFTVLPNTVPNGVTTSDPWGAVGDIQAHPTDANVIFAATSGGFRRSDDGGATWQTLLNGSTRDFTIDVNGGVWVDNGSRLMYSANGSSGSFNEISSPVGGAGVLPRTNGRQRIAVSPQDPNYVYVVQLNGSALKGVYRSTDAGSTWTQIGSKGQQFDPMCSGSNCQGTYDLLFAVSPKNKDRIWLGGITTWTWTNNQWSQVNTTLDSPGNPYYIHSDVHEMIFDPKNPNICWIGSDGGLFKSSDHGVTWTERNLNFRTIQFYKFGVGQGRELIGGTQDNGTQLIDGSENFNNYATRIRINNALADGGEADISWLAPKVMFGENQHGDLGRSENGGESFSSFFELNMLTNIRPFNGGFSNWIMPYELYETVNDPLSRDSVQFYAFPAAQSLGFGDGQEVTFSDTLPRPYDPAVFDAASFHIVSGGLMVTSDGAGVLSGDATGSFDKATGYYTVTFNTAPLAEIVVECNVSYPAGATLTVSSGIGALPYDVTLSQTIQPLDTVMFQDPVQSFLIAGMTSYTGKTAGGVWMTREVHDFSKTPNWWKIGQMNDGETPISMAISADGDVAYIGTTSGRLYRYDNLSQARDDSADLLTVSTSVVTQTMIRTFGRTVTGVAIDPNDNDRVVVTLGQYGGSDYVYYSNNATAASPTFVSVHGNLPNMPVYTASFDKYNAGTIVLGTELGVYATDNVDAANVAWTDENNGMPMVPVFEIEQYRTDKLSPSPNEILEDGDFFIATHGGGFYRTGTTLVNRPVSVEENEFAFDEHEFLNMFPNPARDYTTISFDLATASDVNITVQDLNGRVVKSIDRARMPAGEQTFRLSLDNMSSGVYVVTLHAGDLSRAGKVVVQR